MRVSPRTLFSARYRCTAPAYPAAYPAGPALVLFCWNGLPSCSLLLRCTRLSHGVPCLSSPGPVLLEWTPVTRLSLSGKVALITGASSGIGAGTAILFARLGAKLALNGRNVENLTKVCKECEEVGSNTPLLLPSDLTDEASVKQVIEKTVSFYGQLDVLVNSAGILLLGTIESTSMEQFDHIMNVNVRSVFHLTRLAVPHLIKTKGCIVNVSSVNGQRSFPGVVAYCMSKSALDQFTRCMALDLAPKNVRVNAVSPGVIITDIHKRAGLTEEAYAEFLNKCKQTHALGRPGQVDEVAQAIAFLASDAASFITGVTLPVDGGRHAMCPR